MNAPTRPTLAIINGHATTTSNQIAEHFGKRHDTVLRAIVNLECSPEYRARNFAETFQTVEMPNCATRQDKAFTITRDGFVFLAMGFTGKEAAQWKEAYIEAFNAMEAALQAAPPLDARHTPYLSGKMISDFGLSSAETTALQSVILSKNMLSDAFDLYLPARVAMYSATLSLLGNACELLKQERVRLCRVMEAADGGALGDPANWPDIAAVSRKFPIVEPAPRVALDNGKEYKLQPGAALEGGAA
jgi:Rha family phage regulatory protein